MLSSTAQKRFPIPRRLLKLLQTPRSTYALNIVSRRQSFRCGLTTSWLTIAHCTVRLRSTGIHFERMPGKLNPSFYHRANTASLFGCDRRLRSTNSLRLSWGVSPKTIQQSCRSTLSAREKRCAWHCDDRGDRDLEVTPPSKLRGRLAACAASRLVEAGGITAVVAVPPERPLSLT